MLLDFLEYVGKCVVRSAVASLLAGLQEQQDATPEPRLWYRQLPGSGADPVLLEHLDRLDEAEYRADQRFQHGRRDDDAWLW